MSEQLFQIGIKALIRNDSGEILLLEETFDGTSYWDIPGGRIDEDEEVLDTLARELKEEIAVEEFEVVDQLSAIKSVKKIPHGDITTALMLVVYIVRLGKGQRPRALESHASISWKSPDEAARLLADKYPSEFCERVKNLQ